MRLLWGFATTGNVIDGLWAYCRTGVKDRWQAVSAINAQDLGSGIIRGVRQGSSGRRLIAINMLENIISTFVAMPCKASLARPCDLCEDPQ